MHYVSQYHSPLGDILLAADDQGLSGLWFYGQKYFAQGLAPGHEEQALPVFGACRAWLDLYFAGNEPDFMPPLHLTGTDFQQAVWQILLTIPYGKTVSYGEIAASLARSMGKERMSARAVGNAVGRNRISLIVPCHRVVGAQGSLTGYAAGIGKKKRLLLLEQTGRGKQTILT